MSLFLSSACCTSTSPAAKPHPWIASCDHPRLQSAAQELESSGQRDAAATDLAVKTLIEGCEVPVIELYIAMLSREPTDIRQLPPYDPWYLMRRSACPGWDEAVVQAASLPWDERAVQLWEHCKFARFGFWDAPTFAACGNTPLPFVVFEILVASGVEESTSRTLCRQLCDRPPDSQSP